MIYWVCSWRGYHVRSGVGCGTSDETTIWSAYCHDCGAALSPDYPHEVAEAP